MHAMTPATLRWLRVGAVAFAVLMIGSGGQILVAFGWPAVLRDDPGDILRFFASEQIKIAPAYYGTVLGALGFTALALVFYKAVDTPRATAAFIAAAFGALSGFSQAIGPARWVFVVPGLAETYVDPGSTPALRAAAVTTFQAIHHFAGAMLAEHLGMICRAIWLALLGFALIRSRNVQRARAVGGLGVGLAVATCAAALEPIEGPFSVLSPLTVPAHIAWLGWVVLVAFALRPGRGD